MGYRVFDKQAQQYQAADEKTLPNLMSSGRFKLAPGETIRVIGPDGEQFEANDQTNFAELEKNGFRIENKVDQIRRERKEWAADSPVIAAGVGAIRGAIGGLSDLATMAPGLESFNEGAAALREENPIASVVGELGGTIGSIGLAPGASVPGAFSRIGQAVTRTVAEDLGVQLGQRVVTGLGMQTADKVGRRAVARFTGNALEGALYGGAQALTETSLGDPDKAAQNFISNVAMGGLWGGALGSIPGVFGDVFRGEKGKKLQQGVMEATDVLQGASSSLLTRATQGAVQKGTSGAVDAYTGMVSAINGLDDSVLKQLTSEPLQKGPKEALRGRLLRYMENPDAAKVSFSDGMENLFKVTNDLSYRVTGDVRGELIESLGQAQGVVARKAYFRAVDTVKKNLDNMNAMLKGPDANVYDTAAISKLKTVTETARKELHEVYKNKDRKVSDVYKVLQKYRKNYDNFSDQYFGSTLSQQANYTKGFVKSMRDNVSGALGDETAFGLVGKENKELNKVISKFMAAKENFLDNFGKKEVVPGREIWVLDPGKMGGFLNNQQATNNALRKKYFDAYFDSIEDVIKAGQEKGAGDILKGIDGMAEMSLESMKLMRAQLGEVRESMFALNRLQSWTGKSLYGIIGGAMAGAVAGYAGDQIAGGVGAGAALGAALANPVTMFRILARTEQNILHNQTKIGSAINRFLGGAPIKETKGASPMKGGAMNALAQMISATNRAPEDDETDLGIRKKIKFDDKIDKSVPQIMTELRTVDPMKVVEVTQNRLEGMGAAAPNVSMAASITMARATQFLQSKIPQDYNSKYSLTPMLSKFRPTDSEIAKFKRYVDGVMSPQESIAKIAKGTFTKEHAEALKAVYPDMYQQVREHIAETLTELKKDVPYNKKLQLAVLLDMPTLSVLTPKFLNQIQSVYNPENAQGSQTKPLPTDLASENATPAQIAMAN